MAVVDEILKFNENDVLTCPRSALDDGLRALRGAITEWPINRHDELMKRRMIDLAPVDANTSDAAISDMFEALTPWPLPGVPIVDFDPFLPQLHSIYELPREVSEIRAADDFEHIGPDVIHWHQYSSHDRQCVQCSDATLREKSLATWTSLYWACFYSSCGASGH